MGNENEYPRAMDEHNERMKSIKDEYQAKNKELLIKQKELDYESEKFKRENQRLEELDKKRFEEEMKNNELLHQRKLIEINNEHNNKKKSLDNVCNKEHKEIQLKYQIENSKIKKENKDILTKRKKEAEEDRLKYKQFRINNEFTLKDLEKTLLSIHIYEFTDEININIFNNINELPEEYKQKCKYKSFLIMDLLSFVFKSKKCDFLMIGNKGLSSNTRICFNCDILHREKIKIKAKSSNN